MYEHPATDSMDFTFSTGHPVGPGTSYVKQAFTYSLPFNVSVTKFETVNDNSAVVHHMLLYECDERQQNVKREYALPKVNQGMVCRNLLNNWKETKAYMNDVYLLPKLTVILRVQGAALSHCRGKRTVLERSIQFARFRLAWRASRS